MRSEALPSTHRFQRIAAAGVITGILLAGCGGSKPSSVASAETAGGIGGVDVRQFQFMPAELAVTAGTRVTWTSHDDILHTATSGATPGTADGRFDGPMDGRGKSFSHTFDQPGRYPYFCSRHTSMTGAVVVQ